MKDELLLLLESMYLPERRDSLSKLLDAIETGDAEMATEAFNDQLVFLEKLIGEPVNINRTGRADVDEFIWLIKKSRRTLLGRRRLIDRREAGKEDERSKKSAAVSGGQVEAGEAIGEPDTDDEEI